MENQVSGHKSSLEDNPAYLLNRSLVSINLRLLRAFKDKGFDITPQHWVVLNTLWEREGLFQAEIADIANKDKPNITRILDVMEKNKLIFRLPSKDDRRKFKIYLTEQGKNLKKKLISIAEEVDGTAYTNITAKELEIFKKVLNRIYDNLK